MKTTVSIRMVTVEVDVHPSWNFGQLIQQALYQSGRNKEQEIGKKIADLFRVYDKNNKEIWFQTFVMSVNKSLLTAGFEVREVCQN